MKAVLVAVTLFWIPFAWTWAGPLGDSMEPDELRIVLESKAENPGSIQVKLLFRGAAAGKTIIRFPKRETELISAMEIGSQETRWSETRALLHPSLGVVQLNYVLKLPSSRGSGAAQDLFVLPESTDAKTYQVHIVREGELKMDWILPLQAEGAQISLDQLRTALVIWGSSLTQIETVIGHQQVRFYFSDSVSPQASVLDSKWIELMRRLMLQTDEFWSRFGPKEFPIDTLVFLYQPLPSSEARVSRSEKTWVFETAREMVTRAEQKTWIEAELFKAWEGGRFSYRQPIELSAWFKDGLAAYYGRLLSFRSGAISAAEFVSGYNQLSSRISKSPFKAAANEIIARDYDQNSELRTLAIDRGDLLLSHWNAQIRRQSRGKNSLDDFLEALFAHLNQSHSPVCTWSLEESSRAFIPFGILTEIRTVIDQGKGLPIRADLLGPCATLQTSSPPVFKPILKNGKKPTAACLRWTQSMPIMTKSRSLPGKTSRIHRFNETRSSDGAS